MQRIGIGSSPFIANPSDWAMSSPTSSMSRWLMRPPADHHEHFTVRRTENLRDRRAGGAQLHAPSERAGGLLGEGSAAQELLEVDSFDLRIDIDPDRRFRSVERKIRAHGPVADADYRRLQPQGALVKRQLRLQPIERQDRYVDVIGLEGDIGIHRVEPAEIDLLVREAPCRRRAAAVFPFAAACSPSLPPGLAPMNGPRSFASRLSETRSAFSSRRSLPVSTADRAAHVAAAHLPGHIGQPPLGAATIDVADNAVGRAWRQRDTGNREQICGVVAADVELQIEHP